MNFNVLSCNVFSCEFNILSCFNTAIKHFLVTFLRSVPYLTQFQGCNNDHQYHQQCIFNPLVNGVIAPEGGGLPPWTLWPTAICVRHLSNQCFCLCPCLKGFLYLFPDFFVHFIEICLRPKVPRYLWQFPGARSGSKSSESGISAVRACRIAMAIGQRDRDKKTVALSP